MTPHIIMALSNFGPIGVNFPKLAVIHAMAEYIKFEGKVYHAVEWLEKIGLSAHVLPAPNGDMYRTRWDTQGAHHAKGFNIDKFGNPYSLGMEILVEGEHDYGTFLEAISKPYITEKQMEVVIWQCRNWRKEHGLYISDFRRHSDLSPERKVDPGKGMGWDVFLETLA